MNLLFASLIDASIVLVLGLAATVALRRHSAALRHAILALTIVCAALMPVFEGLLPVIAVFEPASSSSGLTLTSGDVVANTGGQTSVEILDEGIQWATVFVGVWMVGVVVTLGGLLTGLVRLALLRRRSSLVTGRWRELTDELAREYGINHPVTLLQSTDPSLLVTYGVLKPGIILPAGATHWTDDRRRIVLRHELAHITRHDAAIQLVGEALRVMQPINPLVWIACHRLRQESEYACDDAVLGGGVEATSYASHLLAVAKQLSGRHVAWASAPAIAHPSTLERRIVAMLHRKKNREPLTRLGWCAAAVVALGVSLPLAAAGVASVTPDVAEQTVSPKVTAPQLPTPTTTIAQTPRPTSAVAPRVRPVRTSAAPSQAGTVTGRVTDQSGGVMPGATLTLTDLQTRSQQTTIASPTGFRFTNLPPGEYELMARLSGFKSVVTAVTVSSGNAVDQTITLPIGSLSETVTVQCTAPSTSILEALFPVLHAQDRPVTPIRIGGQIREPRKTKHVAPACPADLPSGDTTVVVTGTLGVDGSVTDIEPVASQSGAQPSSAMIEAVAAAVREWTFSPTQLNGRPVEVTITVTVNFKK
jgi:beta-lactamase regulating signal transducer with metallopeptidase domain/outer membrane biosynthesis protein TonB